MNNAISFKGYNGIFAERLRMLMDDSKTTQEVLAKQTGTARQTISQYMDGSALPNVEKLYKICAYFDVASDYLLGLSNSKNSDVLNQHIQNKLGLSNEAIQNLEELYKGRPGQLFPLPFDIGVIDYMLANKDFMMNYPKRLSRYFDLKIEDENIDDIDNARYLIKTLVERLVDHCYNEFYRPTRIDKRVIRKPGRKRNVTPNDVAYPIHNEKEVYILFQ